MIFLSLPKIASIFPHLESRLDVNTGEISKPKIYGKNRLRSIKVSRSDICHPFVLISSLSGFLPVALSSLNVTTRSHHKAGKRDLFVLKMSA